MLTPKMFEITMNIAIKNKKGDEYSPPVTSVMPVCDASAISQKYSCVLIIGVPSGE
jgi:hypothetical protein